MSPLQRRSRGGPPAWSPAWSNLASTQGWDRNHLLRRRAGSCLSTCCCSSDGEQSLACPGNRHGSLRKRKQFLGGRSSIVPASFQHQHRSSIAPIVPALSQHRSSILASFVPASLQQRSSMVPAWCQHRSSSFPASFQHGSSTVPASLQHRSSIAPASLQPKQSSGIAGEAKTNQQQHKRGQTKPSSKTIEAKTNQHSA